MEDPSRVQEQLHRPATNESARLQPSRHDQYSRLSNTTPSPQVGRVRYTGELKSLSSLYQPAFKPYSFSHMYDSKYSNDFQGRFWPPPSPARIETANYAPIKHQFRTTTYQDHFQKTDPFKLSLVMPFSRHRKNNPQPKMVNTYHYPDRPRWIWDTEASHGARASTAGEKPANQQRYHRWYSR